MRVEIEHATSAHAEVIAARIRAEDALEIRRSSGQDPLPMLFASLRSSMPHAYTLFFDGDPVAMFGVSPITSQMPEFGAVWLVGTSAVAKHPKTFVKLSRLGVEFLLGIHPRLVNAVDAQYDKAIRWLERLGAKVGEPFAYGIAGAPFMPFLFEAEAICANR